MSEETQAMPSRRYQMSAGLLGLVGFLCGCASVLVAGRWGCPPVLLGLAGLILLPLISFGLQDKTKRVRGGWYAQIAVLVVVVVALAGVARWTARITPEQAFFATFAMPMPPTVTQVNACQQHFDGNIIALAFHADAQDVKALLHGRNFQLSEGMFIAYREGKVSWPQFWQAYASPWVEIARPGWPNPPLEQATAFFECNLDPNSGASVRVFWDEKSGQVYVLYIGD